MRPLEDITRYTEDGHESPGGSLVLFADVESALLAAEADKLDAKRDAEILAVLCTMELASNAEDVPEDITAAVLAWAKAHVAELEVSDPTTSIYDKIRSVLGLAALSAASK